MSFVWISLLFFSHTSAAVAVHRHAAGIVLPGCHYFLPCCGANEACKWGNGIMKSFLNNMRAGSARRDWLQVTISGINYCLCCHLIAAFQWMPPPPRLHFPTSTPLCSLSKLFLHLSQCLSFVHGRPPLYILLPLLFLLSVAPLPASPAASF